MDALSLLFSPTVWIIPALCILYWYGTSTFDYFKSQGINGPKPLPYFGNMWGVWKKNIPKYDKELAAKYGRTFGYFDGTLPNLYTTDINLIKSIFVKDFDHFVNRRTFSVKRKVFRKMLTIIQDKEWKDVRSSVTPVFTTGKIKLMSKMITECANRLVIKFQKIAETEGKLNAKMQFSAFTMDVIARCAFGMAIDNLGEKDDPFMTKAKVLFSPPANKSPLILLPFMLPNVLGFVGESIFFPKEFDFFINILEGLIKQRSNSTEKYHDFVEVATEAILEHTKTVDGKQVPIWTREEVDEIVTSQSMLFMLAGFDTTATTLTNSAFLLARNPEVQERLYDEVVRKHEQFSEVNHEMILDFPYVDHVIHEVLRMYPPLLRVERMCNKEVTYNGVHIKKGMIVTVPAFALHYDEEYYPDPNRFNPDRWDSESEIKPNPNVFMPFGMGPRNCVGMRFAIEEMKIALCTLVKNFRFFPVAETPEEMQFEDGFIGVIQPIHATVGIESRC
ncbi:cytochrome P450 3A24-like [Daphnia pulicaria]|uniref:cytochrome P450 3A24-like n=1 Tax=Daphnia pulicaria TaxID=35523 RepID=UPI001EE9F7D7|nr:cytochrome P450 3A24-like [Daphnia pulicaria]